MPKSETANSKKNPRAQAEYLECGTRLKRMLKFDVRMRGKEAILIGTDEVGRGCLAGPVVAAAVILPPIRTGSKLSQALEDLHSEYGDRIIPIAWHNDDAMALPMQQTMSALYVPMDIV